MYITPMVPATMFGWLPFVAWLFSRFRPTHRAVIAGFLLAWMFLPEYDYHLPALPTYDKISAASYGILLGMWFFDRGAFSRVRFHACDLPVALWCGSSFLSSVTNGLGAYDGASAMLAKTVAWGVPYYIGRVYFDQMKALKELAIGIFLGALVYIPFCWVEFAISPRLHKMLYGFHVGNFGQTKRSGGWRPMVFMKHGLMCGMWMASGSLAGLRLVMSRNLEKTVPLLRVPTVLALVVLLITLVLLKSFGALVLMIGGAVAIAIVGRMKWLLPVLAISLVPIAYVSTRGSGWWDAQNLIDASLAISNEERSESLAFRIKNENILIDKALDQPLFGWAGWKRSFVFNSAGVPTSVPDGLWVIALGQNGLFGLATLTLTLLLPQWLFMRVFPAKRWREQAVAAVAPLAVLLGLFMIDNLFNDMFNPVMLLAAGGITGLFIRHQRGESLLDDEPAKSAPPAAMPRLL